MQINGYQTGGHVVIKVLDFKAQLKKVVAKAFAVALTGVLPSPFVHTFSCCSCLSAHP